jgi:hypothetical protein
MVPRCITDVIQVVVFTTRPYATLATCRPGIATVFTEGESVLELNHACIGEQQGWIIARHQGRRLNDRMTFTFEVTQKCAAELAAIHI